MLNMRCFLLYCLLWINSYTAIAQYKLLARIDTPALSVSIDNLDNIYLVSAKNELLKYDEQGRFQSSYSNKLLGPDFIIDVSDPLQLVLYSSASRQLILLNNKLAELSRYRFDKEINRNITLLASAGNSGFWIFDQSNQQLCKLSKTMHEEYLSANIFQLSGIRLQPNLLLADEQHVYLSDPQAGVMQFDRFGAYVKMIQTDGILVSQLAGGKLSGLKGNQLHSIDSQSGEISATQLPVVPPRIRQVVSGTRILALLTVKGVYIFAR